MLSLPCKGTAEEAPLERVAAEPVVEEQEASVRTWVPSTTKTMGFCRFPIISVCGFIIGRTKTCNCYIGLQNRTLQQTVIVSV